MSPDDNFTRERFLFTSEALPDKHALHVVRFSGHEGLSELYAFELTLATREKHLPLDLMLSKKGTFTILGEHTPDAKFSGFPTRIVQTSRYNDWTFYRLTLQPGFWYYTQTVQNNFFIDKKVRDLLEGCLAKLDKCQLSYEFKLEGNYKKQEFSMQHNENLFDYMAWKMERDGIYYYFEEKEKGEHVIFTDSKKSHTALDNVKSLRYSPTSGMENAHREEVVTSFSLNCSPLPQWVVLREYDWRNPNTPIIAKHLVSENGLGEVYYYGEGFRSTQEGNRLAAIRAEALQCRAKTWNGTSAVPVLRPGRNFTLENHYDESFNREYTVTSLTHEGSQEAYLSQAIGVPIDNPDKLYYRNSFTCIASDEQFRPERKTQRAKVSGMISAFIDSSSESGVAEVNDSGCYKVTFPQDNGNSSPGNASCWIRRMQPHVGQHHGFTLPLTPGIEVLIAFMDGDPDRPVIAGAVSNAETGFMEHSGSAQAMGLNTAGGNSLVFNDKGTKQGLMLKTGGRSGIMMSSGSTDAVIKFSENNFETYNSISAQDAGLIQDARAGFEQTLKADHAIFSLKHALLIEPLSILADGAEWAASSLEETWGDSDDAKSSENNNEENPDSSNEENLDNTNANNQDSSNQDSSNKDSSDSDDTNDSTKTHSNVLDCLSYSATAIKTALQMYKMFIRSKSDKGKFSATLTTENDASALTMRTSLEYKDIVKYMIFWVAKNSAKIGADATYFGYNVKHEDVAYKKRAATRTYVSETAAHLLGEITALITTFYAKKKLYRASQPEGILIDSKNGVHVNKAEKIAATISKTGILLSAVKQPNLTDIFSDYTPNQYDNLSKDNNIRIQSNTIENIGLNKLDNISCNTITQNAPTIELTTENIFDVSTKLQNIRWKHGNTNPDLFSRYDDLSDTFYGKIKIESDNQSKKNNICIENNKGIFSLSNSAKETSDNLSIKHQTTEGKDFLLDFSNNKITLSYDKKNFIEAMSEGTFTIANTKESSIELSKENKINIIGKNIICESSEDSDYSANKISIYGSKSATITGSSNTLTLDSTGAKINGQLIKLG